MPVNWIEKSPPIAQLRTDCCAYLAFEYSDLGLNFGRKCRYPT